MGSSALRFLSTGIEGMPFAPTSDSAHALNGLAVLVYGFLAGAGVIGFESGA